MKREKTSKYKYVSKHISRESVGSRVLWAVCITPKTKYERIVSSTYKTEREAAIAVDLYLIGQGKEPVNILKRK